MEKGRKESQRKPPRAGGSATSESSAPSEDEGVESGGNLQELLRRAIALGFSGLFTTEATIRGALGDTVPKEWVDFASEQGEDSNRSQFDDSQCQGLDDLKNAVHNTLHGIHIGSFEPGKEKPKEYGKEDHREHFAGSHCCHYVIGHQTKQKFGNRLS